MPSVAEPTKEHRTAQVLIRCTPSERDAIAKAAEAAGQTLSEYVLRQLGLRGKAT
jgi:uncharacterized protein (DUF1778 family)